MALASPAAPAAPDDDAVVRSAPPSQPPSEPRLASQTSATASPARAPAASEPSGATDGQPAAAANVAESKPVVPQSRIVPTRVVDGIRVLPPRFEHCDVEDLIALIAGMLTRLMDHNDRVPLDPATLTRFHSRAPPGISVRDYLLRIARFTNVEPCCLLILLFYVDRICAALPHFTISSLTVHRFVIAAVACGSKALSDSFCTNGRYARVGGVTLAEMNLLEREFLVAVDWRLTTRGAVLERYFSSLVASDAAYRVEGSPASSSDDDGMVADSG